MSWYTPDDTWLENEYSRHVDQLTEPEPVPIRCVVCDHAIEPGPRYFTAGGLPVHMLCQKD